MHGLELAPPQTFMAPTPPTGWPAQPSSSTQMEPSLSVERPQPQSLTTGGHAVETKAYTNRVPGCAFAAVSYFFNEKGVGTMVKREGYVRKLPPKTRVCGENSLFETWPCSKVWEIMFLAEKTNLPGALAADKTFKHIPEHPQFTWDQKWPQTK